MKSSGVFRGAKWFRGKVVENLDNAEQVMTETGKLGEATIKNYIATRGTNYEWSGDWGSWPHGHPDRTASHPGRSASGKMMGAVGYWVNRSDKDYKIRMGVGWTNSNKNKPYFMAQEVGFTHNLFPDIHVSGMWAVQDGVDVAFSFYKSQIKRAR